MRELADGRALVTAEIAENTAEFLMKAPRRGNVYVGAEIGIIRFSRVDGQGPPEGARNVHRLGVLGAKKRH